MVVCACYADNFYQVNFPTDSNGALCGITHPGYPYLYFVNPPQMVSFYIYAQGAESLCRRVPKAHG